MTLQGVSRTGMGLVCAGLIGLLLLSMLVTNPSSLGPGLVTLWFLGFWVVLAVNLAYAKYLFMMRFGSEATKKAENRTIMVSLRHGALVGGGLTILLALSSLQQLDIRDVGLIAAFVILVEFYVRTRR